MPKPSDPAFPIATGQFVGEDRHAGMSLRDYFAGQALMGLLANGWKTNNEHAAETAGRAYYMADAMLAAQEEKSQS